MTVRRSVEVVPDPESAATRAAEWLIEQVAHAVARRGRAVLALSGGSTPRAVYACLARHPWCDRVQWDRVDVFWGDERFVAADDAARNERMAREALLEPVRMPEARIHPMPHDEASDASSNRSIEERHASAERAATMHATQLAAFYGADTLDPARPFFDVVLLGVGDDGHTASIFPGSPAVDERGRWTLATRAPDPRTPVRITLAWPLLESTHAVLILVTGEAKRDIVRRALAGDESLPVARLRPNGGLLWIVDEAASVRAAST